MATYKLEVDGNEVRIFPRLPELTYEGLKSVLSYEPKGAEFSESHKSKEWITVGGKRQFNPKARWDGKISLLKKNRGNKPHTFPTGVLPQALHYLRNVESKTDLRFEVEYLRQPIEPVDQTLEGKKAKLKGKRVTVKLRYYQPDHVSELVNAPMGRGMVESPTASGKSVTISELIYKFPTANILVTVPSLGLLNQTAAVIEGLIGEKVGVFGDGKFEPRRVTVSTIQSLYARRKKQEIIDWLQTIDIWIIDEAHMAAANTFQEVSELLPNTSRRYGVSATIRREDGSEMLFFGLIGPVVARTTAAELVEAGYLAKPTIECHIVEHKYNHNPAETGKKKPAFNSVEAACITESEDHIAKVVEQVRRCKEEGRLPCIIMVNDNLKLGDTLHDRIATLGPTAWLSGEDKLDVRDDVIDQVSKGKVPFLICSTIFDEGIDIPRIRSVILAAGGTSGNKAAQRVGRGLRIDPDTGKTDCLIVDIYSREKYFLSHHGDIRKTWYEVLFPGCVTVVQDGKPVVDPFKFGK